VFLTTTFFIILFTVLFNGGMSAYLLSKFHLKGGPAGGVFTLRRYHSLMENGVLLLPATFLVHCLFFRSSRPTPDSPCMGCLRRDG
jgi:hypothetical protein